MSGTNTKKMEYKRMISRIKAIDTYFKNQISVVNTEEDDLFTSIAHYAMLEAFTKVKNAYNDIYNDKEKGV